MYFFILNNDSILKLNQQTRSDDMKIKYIFYGIIITAILTGCQPSSLNSTVSSKPEENSKINLKEESQKQIERAKQTLWFLIDENGNKKENLPDNNPNVQEVKSLIEQHSKVVDNRTYKSIDAEDEFSLYTKSFAQQLRGDYDVKLLEMYKNNSMEIKRISLAWFETTFSNGFNNCKAMVEVKMEFAKCNADYLEKNQFELNKPYLQQRIIYLTKDEENTWKISNIQKGPLKKEGL